ncbi:FprA family A-type flavoprotein [Lachnoclostridium sp. An118]|uniref:FprA family A-type flavoprotein n=1 Tax=Lachnoclostridium sp. An118 TaxID=1965547 RepID=UPI000B393871|nr:FprA family A-type flavoprotein [Lachnoclostridium sp. An118]OUQ47895.1 flavodoxin [Lachnoclostridium sp. An118]
MQITRKVTDDITWVGCNDRRLALFENLFPIPRGVSYNSYLIQDEKTVLLDTVDSSASQQFLENVAYALKGRDLDYLIVQHMEPDHCGTIVEVMRTYPQAKVVGSVKALQMIGQFYDVSGFDAEERMMAVKEGDTLATGAHTLHFLMAPMVHWPEVMVTYDEKDKALFSADAFGTFGALNGKLFSDEVDFEGEWLPDARRYYANIVGKYGVQVQALLKKAAAVDIQMICPLHGPVWRSGLSWFMDKYDKWSRYEPEDKAVAIIYGSIYGNTENAADALASRLTDKGVKDVKMYDVSRTHVSELIAEIFRCSHVVLACSTYNGGIYPPMADLLEDMKALSAQNRTVALMENGTWAAASGRLITAKLEEMKNITLLDTKISIRSALQNGRETELDAFAQQIVEEMQDGE